MTSDLRLIDEISTGVTVTPDIARPISGIVITPSPKTVTKYANYVFQLTPDLSIPTDGKLTIEVPPSLTIGASVTCNFAIGWRHGTGSGSCSNIGRVISSADAFYDKQ